MNNNKQHLLITGANGQLGRELTAAFATDHRYEVLCTDVAELDITSPEAVEQYFNTHAIDYVVNCAAFTAVDLAESEHELCRKLNVDAVGLLAQAAASHGAKMVHISTDYVFDGNACRPYSEDDPTHPVSAYGSTKLAGEQLMMERCPDGIVIRTAWLYSPHGKNFVKTMLRLGAERDRLSVVFDQVGSPTSATDLAGAIRHIITGGEWHPGIYHYSNEGAISWFDFTIAIHAIAGLHCQVTPCLSEDYPTPAHRPHYSVLDKSKIKRTFHLSIPYWRDSLELCIHLLQSPTA